MAKKDKGKPGKGITGCRGGGKCDDHGKVWSEREPTKGGRVNVYAVTSCSKCGLPVFKDFDHTE